MRRAWRCPAPSPLCWRRVSSQTARSRFRPPWCPISEPTVWFPPVADSDLRRRAGPRAGRVTAMDNVPPHIAGPDDTAGLRDWITRLDAVNAPLVQPGVGTIHYGPLPVAMQFTELAALQGAVFLCLGWLAAWAYRQRLAATRDRLWVAMARESAHQLGTPLMSLTG